MSLKAVARSRMPSIQLFSGAVSAHRQFMSALTAGVSNQGVAADALLQTPEREARPAHDPLRRLQVPSCSEGAPGAPRPTPPLPQTPPRPRPSRPQPPPARSAPRSCPVAAADGSRSESLGGGRMGDSKVKVAVRIRPMNRRGESQARPGPPRRRRQVPGAPFPWPRPPCGVRPAPPLESVLGGRAACAPRNLVPHCARPACAGRPSPRPHSVPGRRGPHVPARCPFRRRARPSPAPFRPPVSLPFQEGARVPRPGLASSFSPRAPALCPTAPGLSARQLSERPPPLGFSPFGLAGTVRDPRPRLCTLEVRVRKEGGEFGLLLRKRSSAKILPLGFSHYVP